MRRRTPSSEVMKILAEATLVLVLFSDASRIGLHPLRADLRLCLRLLGIALPLAIGAALAPTDPGPRRGHDGQPGGPRPGSGG